VSSERHPNSGASGVQFAPFKVTSDSVLLETPMVVPSKVPSNSVSYETHPNTVPLGVQFAPLKVPSECVPSETPIMVPSEVPHASVSPDAWASSVVPLEAHSTHA
jgi:hypothetical protein